MFEDDQQYFEHPDFKRALHQYEEGMQESGSVYMDADDLTDIAEYYMVHGRREEADRAIELAVSLHPDSIDPQVFLSRQQMFQNNLEEAHRICDAIIDQQDREVQFLNAELMIREQETEKAVNYLRGISQEITDERDFFLYDSAGIFLDYSLWEEAKVFAAILEQEYTSFHKLKELKADIFANTGEYESAIPILQGIIDESPYNVYAWNLLAESQLATEQFNEAMDSVEYVFAIDPQNQRAKITKANCFFHLNAPERAHELYREYLAENPQDDVIYFLDSVCLSGMERYQEAAEALTKANEVGEGYSSEQFHIYLQQTYVESKLRHYDQAMEALDKAHAMCIDDPSFEYHLLRGQVCLENGRTQEAEEAFAQAMRISQDLANTKTMIGIAYEECDRYEEAATILQDVVNASDEDIVSTAIPYLAYSYFKSGRTQSYLCNLKRAVQMNRETTQFLFGQQFPNTLPEDYYLYAYKNVYGVYPEEQE